MHHNNKFPQSECRKLLIKKDPALFCTLAIIWICFAIFIFYPIITLLYMAFFSHGHISSELLKKNFLNAYTLKALWNSLRLAAAVSICGTFLGYVFALVVNRTNLPKFLKIAISAITILPLISPPFTSSISLTLALGPNGTLLKLLGIPDANIYGFTGTWISETLTYFPVAYMVISAILNTMSSNLDDAASSLGAKSGRIFRTITAPLSVPAVANSVLLLFGSSLADFATPLILGGHKFPILPTQAYLQITGMFDFFKTSNLLRTRILKFSGERYPNSLLSGYERAFVLANLGLYDIAGKEGDFKELEYDVVNNEYYNKKFTLLNSNKMIIQLKWYYHLLKSENLNNSLVELDYNSTLFHTNSNEVIIHPMIIGIKDFSDVINCLYNPYQIFINKSIKISNYNKDWVKILNYRGLSESY